MHYANVKCSTHERHQQITSVEMTVIVYVPVYRGPMNVLLRKEVIQPHLPVRLPCYDLVLITDPTLDSSPPYGLGHWRWVLPTFMT